jgi:Peptidase inhibitor family I36
VIDRKRIVIFLSGTLLATSPCVFAQSWTSVPREGACFYEHADYRGDFFCARTGESLDSLPSGVNDRISSIRIYGRAEVTVYRDERLRGSSARFDYDVRNLRQENWNDRVSSIRVRRTSSGGSSGGSGDPDRIVRRAYEDILDREPDSAGLRLYRSRIIDDGWTESQVRDALRKSPEYREKNSMTRERAEDIVRRAYLNVLRREPDSGSRGYVDRVMRNKWTQGDVERELRKSPEYRNQSR